MYPLAFRAKLLKLGIDTETANELFNVFCNNHNLLTRAENLITTLQVENTKLKNENEFMLKLIDKYMIGINERMDDMD
jgi:hypothetical protein